MSCSVRSELAPFVVVHVDVAHAPGQHEAGPLRLWDLEQPREDLPLHHRDMVVPPLLVAPLVRLLRDMELVSEWLPVSLRKISLTH